VALVFAGAAKQTLSTVAEIAAGMGPNNGGLAP